MGYVTVSWKFSFRKTNIFHDVTPPLASHIPAAWFDYHWHDTTCYASFRSPPYLQLGSYVRLETNKLKPLMEAVAARQKSDEISSGKRFFSWDTPRQLDKNSANISKLQLTSWEMLTILTGSPNFVQSTIFYFSAGCTSRCVDQPRQTWGLYQYRWMQLIGTCNLVVPAAFLGSMFRIALDSAHYSTNIKLDILDQTNPSRNTIIHIMLHIYLILANRTKTRIRSWHAVFSFLFLMRPNLQFGLDLPVCHLQPHPQVWRSRPQWAGRSGDGESRRCPWSVSNFSGGIFNDCKKDSIATRKKWRIFCGFFIFFCHVCVPHAKKTNGIKTWCFQEIVMKIVTTMQWVYISSVSAFQWC